MGKIIPTGEGYMIVDFLSEDQEQDMLFHDEILQEAEKEPNKEFYIVGDSSVLANNGLFLHLLGYQDNVFASKPLYVLIKNENLKHIRKNLLISNFQDFFNNINDFERISVLLEVLSEEYGISNIKQEKVGISFDKEGKTFKGVPKYTKRDSILSLGNNIGIVENEGVENELFDFRKMSEYASEDCVEKALRFGRKNITPTAYKYGTKSRGCNSSDKLQVKIHYDPCYSANIITVKYRCSTYNKTDRSGIGMAFRRYIFRDENFSDVNTYTAFLIDAFDTIVEIVNNFVHHLEKYDALYDTADKREFIFNNKIDEVEHDIKKYKQVC